VLWPSFLPSRKHPGLIGVELVIGERHFGLVEPRRGPSRVSRTYASGSTSPASLGHVQQGQTDYVAAAFRMIFAELNAEDVRAPGGRSAAPRSPRSALCRLSHASTGARPG
jgi:putative transposase